MFAIVQWNSFDDVSIVFNEDGTPALFSFAVKQNIMPRRTSILTGRLFI